MQKRKRINSKKSLYIIGSLFIFISFLMIVVDYYKEYKTIEREEQAINEYYEEPVKEVKTETVESIETTKKEEVKKNKEIVNYIGILRIPKINLKKGLVDINSKYNDIKYNVMIHNKSTFPDVVGGNFILLAHSGSSSISFFKNLDKLKLDDKVYVDYNGNTYEYKLINIYDIEKNGKAVIKKTTTKSTITLITCRNNTNKQIVLIGELVV
ncbi:MAG: sortase [Bacilli bacterium]|nr:sortase [Bacilli bacterium]